MKLKIRHRIPSYVLWTQFQVWSKHLQYKKEMEKLSKCCQGKRSEHTKVYTSIYLFYIPWPFPPIWGVADNTKETTKTIGVSLRSSSNDEGSSRVWMALLEQHNPSSPVFHNLRCFIDAVSPTAPTTGLPLQGNPLATADANQNCVTIIRHSFLFLARSLASLISILLSFRALFTPSIHPNLGLPLAFLPSTFAFITFFSSRSLSILSTWPNHLNTSIPLLPNIHPISLLLLSIELHPRTFNDPTTRVRGEVNLPATPLLSCCLWRKFYRGGDSQSPRPVSFSRLLWHAENTLVLFFVICPTPEGLYIHIYIYIYIYIYTLV